MKKRMLITTIVMLLVLAVALTTSSLAWFSASQATVNVTGGTFTASAAGSAANIGVAKAADASNWGNSSTMVTTGSDNLVPLCAISKFTTNLNADLAEAKALNDLVNADTLNGAKMLTDGEGRQVFPLDEANPSYKNALSSQANSVIYAKNLDTNETVVISLKVTLKITSETTGVAAPNFYIVLSTANGNSVIRTAVLSKTGGYAVYNFAGKPQNTLTSAADEVKETGDATINNAQNAEATVTFSNLSWNAGVVYAIHVYAWYEGVELDVTTQRCTTTYDLTLEAGIPANA